MELNKIRICDSGLFVSGDNTLRHFRNNGIQTVEQLVSIKSIDDLILGERTRKQTKDALKAILSLAKYKYLGEPMEMTASLDDFFYPVGYGEQDIYDRRVIASNYFLNMGFRPIDSAYIFRCLYYEFKDGVKLIDGFCHMFGANKDYQNSCRDVILSLYIDDYYLHNFSADASLDTNTITVGKECVKKINIQK